MKIVLSRKGFDSKNGGKPSPVFPDGTTLSLPIPLPGAPTQFRDVLWRDSSLEPIVECLSKHRGEDSCHLDPDLRADALQRSPEWRPTFGQDGAAQGHLKRQGVRPGDLFLFFGWFRPVAQHGRDKWRYVEDAPSVHRLFGWLQVSEILTIGPDPASARTERPWLSAHPHLHGHSWPDNNTVYISTPTLSVAGIDRVRGAGVFRNADSRLTLTEPREIEKGSSCKWYCWRLPDWFWPAGGASRISRKVNKVRRDGRWVYVKLPQAPARNSSLMWMVSRRHRVAARDVRGSEVNVAAFSDGVACDRRRPR